VLDAEDRPVPLGGDPTATEPYQRGYLAYVWEVVARAALEQVLGTDEAKARPGEAGAVEEDARLPALFLWTLQGLDRTLARLPDNVRATFLLSRVDGLTYPQIAAELGISLRSVSVYMTRSEALCIRHSANQSLNRPLPNKRSA